MIRRGDGSLDLEMLVAYADRALADADAARVSTALATDAEAAGMVDALRVTGGFAAAAFDDVLAAPVPARLIAAASGRGAVVDFARHGGMQSDGAHHRSWQRVAAAIAASLLLVIVGFAGGHWMAGTGIGPDLQPAGTSPAAGIEDPAALGGLYAILSHDPAAGRSLTYDGGSIALEAPLALVDGAICWQFRLMPASASAIRGIACPDAAGGWAILTRAERGEMP